MFGWKMGLKFLGVKRQEAQNWMYNLNPSGHLLNIMLKFIFSLNLLLGDKITIKLKKRKPSKWWCTVCKCSCHYTKLKLWAIAQFLHIYLLFLLSLKIQEGNNLAKTNCYKSTESLWYLERHLQRFTYQNSFCKN